MMFQWKLLQLVLIFSLPSTLECLREVIAAGKGLSCALLDDGSVKCWGVNSSGQLGYGDTGVRYSPPDTAIDLGTGRTAIAITAGDSHVCVLLDDRSVKCWGENSNGQLGYGDTTNRESPPVTAINLGKGHPALAIRAGVYHTCALLDDGSIKCWGDNAVGQLGYEDYVSRSSPGDTAIDLGTSGIAVAVMVGEYHTCVLLDDASIKCWGLNSDGQLGYGDSANRNSPPAAAVHLGTGRTALAITTSYYHTCALLDIGSIKCWGRNNYGQLGYGDSTDRNSPPATSINLGGHTAVAIAAGYYHTCALLDNGSVKCWGRNNYGQLGYGDSTDRNSPPTTSINLGTGRTALAIAVGQYHTCTLLDNGSIKCWGGQYLRSVGLWECRY